jgi:flagellar biosynthetic protein FlhB
VAGGDSGEKTEKPTPKRLKEARDKGQIARTPDLATWLGMLAVTVLIQTTMKRAGPAFTDMLHSMGEAMAHPDIAVSMRFAADAAWTGAMVIAPLLIGLLVVAFVANVAQVGFKPTTKKMAPDFSRLNPFKGMKRMVAMSAWWELGKSVVKTIVLALVAWPIMSHAVGVLTSGTEASVLSLTAVTAKSALTLIRNISAVGLVIAAADYAYQRHSIMKKLKMSRQELRDEYKNQEGNPQMKSAMRSRAAAISRNQMIRSVSMADVVVVNPTHYSVALKYDAAKGAPQVVAKGVGEMAANIRKHAEKAGVPIVREPVLTRAIYASCEVGQLIPAELYEVVAHLLAFVFGLRARGRASGYHDAPLSNAPALL